MKRQLLTIFWEGTANTLNPITTQIGVFSESCCAVPVWSPDQVPADRRCPLKLSFDGCGVTHGDFWGGLFARGLDEQCDLAVRVVERMLQQQEKPHSSHNYYSQNDGDTDNDLPDGVHVVALGLSRGGVACMKLAQKLAKKFAHKTITNSNNQQPPVTASLLLFDPVPGNAVSTGFPWTACWSQDLSQCHNLVRVLALYPYEALPDVAMHAPSLCTYSKSTLVQEDVTLGCHQGALFLATPRPTNPYEVASNLSMRRIIDFLELEGVQCQFARAFYVPSPHECIKLMERALKKYKGTQTLRRKTHDQTGRQRQILRHRTSSSSTTTESSSSGGSDNDNDNNKDGNDTYQRHQWLNKHHEQLATALQEGTSTASEVAVYGKPNNSSASSITDNDARNGDWQFVSSQPTYQLEFDDGHITCTTRLTSTLSSSLRKVNDGGSGSNAAAVVQERQKLNTGLDIRQC